MRVCLIAAVLLCPMTASASPRPEDFPYKAYVTAKDVYVRSGPGRNYYPTEKLQSGEQVEVYRHDPGGWYAVRPTEGDFTWVSGRFIKLGEDGVGEITGDRVAGRVGSQFSDIRDVIQVRFHKGELVEVLDTKRFDSGTEAGTWYKVAPPSGEFRWIFGRYVSQEEPSPEGIRKAPAGRSPLVQSSGGASDLAGVSAPAMAETAASEPAERSKDSAAEQSGLQPQAEEDWMPVAGEAEAEAAAQRYTNKFANPATDPDGAVTMRRISPEEFQAELDDVNVELSIMLVEEPTVWTFAELGMRARALLTEAETALERGRAQAMVRRIGKSEEIKGRFDQVAVARTRTERHNRQLADLSRIRGSLAASQSTDDRFDGSGRLARVDSAKLGSPRYALLDENGDLRCYVTPAPGVRMEYYLGRQIGINGIRGYMAEQNTRHVTAKHVVALEERTLR